MQWPAQQQKENGGAAGGARVILARPPTNVGRPTPTGILSRGSSSSTSSSSSGSAAAPPPPPPPPPVDDDDPWSHIGPSSEDTNNRRVWIEANNATRTPSSMPLLPANAPPIPPSNSLRILRRPSPGSATGGSSGTSSPAGGFSGNRPVKSLSERELEYQRARERIFGSGEDAAAGVSTPGGSSSTNTSQAGDSSETESKASGSVEGSGRRKKKPQQQQQQRRDGSATPPTTVPRTTNGGARPKRGEPTTFEMLRPPKADRRTASRGPGPGQSDSGIVRQPIGPDDLSMGFRNLHVAQPPPRVDTYPYGGQAAGPAFGGYYGAAYQPPPAMNARPPPPPASNWHHQYPPPPSPAFAVDYSLGGYPNPNFGYPQHPQQQPPPPPPPQPRDGRMPYQPWQ